MSHALHRPVRESLEEYGRGVAGGLLFSLPLLYTMEMWWRGFTAGPAALLIYMVVTFMALLGYNRYSGMHPSASPWEVVIDSIEEIGLGIVLAAGILYLMGRIVAGMPLYEIVGKIVIEAMTVAIGVSVGTAQLGGERGGEDEGEAQDQSAEEAPPVVDEPQDQQEQLPSIVGQLVLGFCGAFLIASNVAPTEEILIIGIEASPVRLLALLALSLLVCALVLFYTGFAGAETSLRRDGPFWIAFGVVSSYAVALLASALMLWFFGRFDGAPLTLMVAETVVLGFPAVLGASAGRLLID